MISKQTQVVPHSCRAIHGVRRARPDAFADLQVGPDSMIGEFSQIGDRCSIKKSVIGKHCVIGKHVKIVNSVLMDYVVLEDK